MKKIADTAAAAGSFAKRVYRAAEETAVGGYEKIERGVVWGYEKIERGAVEGFEKLTDRCVQALFAKEGESVQQARARLKNQKNGK